MSTESDANLWHTRGKQEMHKLATGTFAALQEAELADRLDSLHARVFDRSPQDLMDVVLVDGVWEWRFKPMIELLLRHIAATASCTKMSLAERQTEIMWAVEIAGF